MSESIILNEASRQDLLKKGKAGDNYAASNQDKGKNRYERRRYSSIANSVRQYNNLDMNTFFKYDVLNVGILVKGETDNYIVKLRFDNVLREIESTVKANKDKLEFKTILLSLTRTFNRDDVWISCTCDDWKYRMAYYATKNKFNSGVPEMRPSKITNPADTKGCGCKHSLLVIANVDWIMKVASVINNYIKYMEETSEDKYARFIYPKLYGKAYTKPAQTNIFDLNNPDELDSDSSTLDTSNTIGKDRGKFRADRIVNNQKKFERKPKEINNQSLFDLIDDDAKSANKNNSLESEIDVLPDETQENQD